jgi:hypothetical protein
LCFTLDRSSCCLNLNVRGEPNAGVRLCQPLSANFSFFRPTIKNRAFQFVAPLILRVLLEVLAIARPSIGCPGRTHGFSTAPPHCPGSGKGVIVFGLQRKCVQITLAGNRPLGFFPADRPQRAATGACSRADEYPGRPDEGRRACVRFGRRCAQDVRVTTPSQNSICIASRPGGSADIPQIPGSLGVTVRMIEARRNEIRSEPTRWQRIVALPASVAPKLVALP